MSEQISNETVVNEKPLVTFALFAYNQEKYIREAVEGALAQTYSPLQIILSDDCSSDRTFEIIQEMVAEYAGPHEILLNRNEPNLGLAGHINYVMSLAKGELIVVAAGDDISLPIRVESLLKKWISPGVRSSIIYSNIDLIDVKSEVFDEKCHTDFSKKTLEDFINKPFALICSYAINANLLKKFPPLSNELINEDFIFPLRALLTGGRIQYIEDSLVRYRVGSGVSSENLIQKKSRRNFKIEYSRKVTLWNQINLDLIEYKADIKYIKKARSSLDVAIKKMEFCSASRRNALKILVKINIKTIDKVSFFITTAMPRVKSILNKYRNI